MKKFLLLVGLCVFVFGGEFTAVKFSPEQTEKMMSELEAEGEKYKAVLNRTQESFREEREQTDNQIKMLEQKKEDLEQTDSGKRIEECLVVACTIDVCLSRLPLSKENRFEHVFLDEAGYSSLIKATVLTAYGDRLTFLGDHMQLPPVCEADEGKIRTGELQLISFWAQSALYAETVFSETTEQICEDYRQKACIRVLLRADIPLPKRRPRAPR